MRTPEPAPRQGPSFGLQRTPTLGEGQTSPPREIVAPGASYAVFRAPTAGVFLGVVSVETWCILAGIPQDASSGAQLRSLKILASADVLPSDTDYWLLQLGKIVTGVWKNITTPVSLQTGLSQGLVKILNFPDPVLVPRRDDLVVRISPRGLPGPMTGVSLLPDWGSLASFRGTGARGTQSGGSRG